MKVTVGQTKRGIILVFEDKDDTSRTIHLNWREAAGLHHLLADILSNPAFKYRDPKGDDSEVRNWTAIEVTSD